MTGEAPLTDPVVVGEGTVTPPKEEAKRAPHMIYMSRGDDVLHVNANAKVFDPRDEEPDPGKRSKITRRQLMEREGWTECDPPPPPPEPEVEEAEEAGEPEA